MKFSLYLIRHSLVAFVFLVLLSGCKWFQPAAELAPDEKGAACIRVEATSVNPFIKGESRAAILEINTGDRNQVIDPELIAKTAEAMGCR